jgi:small subunit ribosomal protein S21
MAFRRNNRNNRRRTNRPRRHEREVAPGPRKQSNVTVVARYNEPPEKLIKRFVRKCKKERIVEQVRERRYFTKPSEEKRIKRAASIREAERLRKKAERKKLARQKRQSKLRRMRAKGGGSNGSTTR